MRPMLARRGKLASVKGIPRRAGSSTSRRGVGTVRGSGFGVVIGDQPGAAEEGGDRFLDFGPRRVGDGGAGCEDEIPAGRDRGQGRPGSLAEAAFGAVALDRRAKGAARADGGAGRGEAGGRG